MRRRTAVWKMYVCEMQYWTVSGNLLLINDVYEMSIHSHMKFHSIFLLATYSMCPNSEFGIWILFNIYIVFGEDGPFFCIRWKDFWASWWCPNLDQTHTNTSTFAEIENIISGCVASENVVEIENNWFTNNPRRFYYL